jgi:uncharacterized RmlC-like cupin family protein
MNRTMGSTAPSSCRVVKTTDEFIGKQGLTYRPGVSAETTGSKGIHLQTVVLPPGIWANAHKHVAHETAIYILSGVSGMWYGPALEQNLEVGAGDYLYIPADMPHQPYNPSNTTPCVAIISRTDPNEQESVVLLPELDRRKA